MKTSFCFHIQQLCVYSNGPPDLKNNFSFSSTAVLCSFNWSFVKNPLVQTSHLVFLIWSVICSDVSFHFCDLSTDHLLRILWHRHHIWIFDCRLKCVLQRSVVSHQYESIHGLQTPNEAFFHWNPELLWCEQIFWFLDRFDWNRMIDFIEADWFHRTFFKSLLFICYTFMSTTWTFF